MKQNTNSTNLKGKLKKNLFPYWNSFCKCELAQLYIFVIKKKCGQNVQWIFILKIYPKIHIVIHTHKYPPSLQKHLFHSSCHFLKQFYEFFFVSILSFFKSWLPWCSKAIQIIYLSQSFWFERRARRHTVPYLVNKVNEDTTQYFANL